MMILRNDIDAIRHALIVAEKEQKIALVIHTFPNGHSCEEIQLIYGFKDFSIRF